MVISVCVCVYQYTQKRRPVWIVSPSPFMNHLLYINSLSYKFLTHLSATPFVLNSLSFLSSSCSSYQLISGGDCLCLLTDRLLAGQWTLQGHASGRQAWTGTGLKHGGDVEGLQAEKLKHVRKNDQTTQAVNQWQLKKKKKTFQDLSSKT